MKRFIWITTDFEGTHSWPECPIEEVKFLQNEHRHIFKVKVQIEITHNDRDIEFFVFKEFIDTIIENAYGLGLKRLGRKSCEDIADMISGVVSVNYPNRETIIEVSEDGEVGCHIEYE